MAPRVMESQMRKGYRVLFAAVGVAMLMAASKLSSSVRSDSAQAQDAAETLQASAAPVPTSPVAFVPGAQRSLLNKRFSPEQDESRVAMHGSSKRNNKYNHPKKLHPKYMDFLDRRNSLMTPIWLQKLTMKKEPTLEKWSQTLKLSFPEGEDDVVTEEEVMEYFTTDGYKPEACIVGHRLPHDPQAHAYVHFNTNEECIKARKEKDGGSIGKASEVKVVYTDEKKWIRLRDGVALTGGPRAAWMRAYGSQMIPEFTDQWKTAELGSRSHPVYPE